MTRWLYDERGFEVFLNSLRRTTLEDIKRDLLETRCVGDNTMTLVRKVNKRLQGDRL